MTLDYFMKLIFHIVPNYYHIFLPFLDPVLLLMSPLMSLARQSDEQGWDKAICFLYHLVYKSVRIQRFVYFNSLHRKRSFKGLIAHPNVIYNLLYATIKCHHLPKIFLYTLLGFMSSFLNFPDDVKKRNYFLFFCV